jgi:hypothetical protein
MSFSRDDLTVYESKPQIQVENHDPWAPRTPQDVINPEATPQAETADAELDAAIASSVTEPTEKGTDNDGSTTETEAETVAAEIAIPEGAKDPELENDPADGRTRSRAQERIEELVAERNALREYGKYLLSQVEAQRKAPQEVTPQVTKTEPEELAPTLESADFDPVKLSKLQTEWLNKQVEKRVESVVKQLETRQSEQAIRQAFEQKTAAFRKDTPDFDTVISNPALPRLAERAAKEVIKSDFGPAIAYRLAKNPDLAARIARLDSDGQVKAIGKIEEQIESSITTQKEPSQNTKPALKPVSVTKAPPPPKPVASGSGVIQKDASIMSMEEWVANERSKKVAERQSKLKLRQAMRR